MTKWKPKTAKDVIMNINNDRYLDLMRTERDHNALRASATRVRDEAHGHKCLYHTDAIGHRDLNAIVESLDAALAAAPAGEPGLCAKCGTTKPGMYMGVNLCLGCYEGHNEPVTPRPGIDPAQVRLVLAIRNTEKVDMNSTFDRGWKTAVDAIGRDFVSLLDGAAPTEPQVPVVAKDVIDALEWALNNLVEPDPITDDDCLMLQGWRDRNQECWGILQRCMDAAPQADEPVTLIEALEACADDDEPCATCGGDEVVTQAVLCPKCQGAGNVIPDCDAPEPEPVTSEQRARWFCNYRPADNSAWSLATTLTGQNDDVVRAWLAAQEATDAK